MTVGVSGGRAGRTGVSVEAVLPRMEACRSEAAFRPAAVLAVGRGVTPGRGVSVRAGLYRGGLPPAEAWP